MWTEAVRPAGSGTAVAVSRRMRSRTTVRRARRENLAGRELFGAWGGTPATGIKGADTVLKVTSLEGTDGRILALDGRLADAWVDEVSRAASAALSANGSALTLDLSGLTYVDARGAGLLRSLRDRGARLVGESSFVATLVGGAT